MGTKTNIIYVFLAATMTLKEHVSREAQLVSTSVPQLAPVFISCVRLLHLENPQRFRDWLCHSSVS